MWPACTFQPFCLRADNTSFEVDQGNTDASSQKTTKSRVDMDVGVNQSSSSAITLSSRNLGIGSTM